MKDPPSPGNAYDWYRRSAHRDGTVWIASTCIPAIKRGRTWTVKAAAVDQAIAAHRAEQTRIAQRTADYKQHILEKDGGQTEWGGYRVSGDFHFAWNDYMQATMRSSGYWYCNTCWEPAQREHGRDECHRCRDWSPCGADCTLTRIYCPECGTSRAC
ncbi:hypothetical protein ABZ746_38730 [Streptomyces sp. NPDC020096]